MDERPVPRTQAEAIEALAVQVGQLAVVLREMRADQQAMATTTDRTDRRGRWTTVLGVLMSLLLTAGLGAAWLSRSEDEARARQTQLILEAIRGCTSPGHDCYDANQQRSNERLAPIIGVLCDALPPEKRRPPCPVE